MRRSPPLRGRVDHARLEAQTEEEIERIARESGAPGAEFWADAVLVPPRVKRPISLRVDEDVLEWFRNSGRGYQTRMNAVLRTYMEHHGG